MTYGQREVGKMKVYVITKHDMWGESSVRYVYECEQDALEKSRRLIESAREQLPRPVFRITAVDLRFKP
jgi:hypothetical protein